MKKEMDKVKIGKIIRELRKERGMSQQELADLLFTTQDTISLWELGKRMPDVKSVIFMANYFSVTTDYILNCADF